MKMKVKVGKRVYEMPRRNFLEMLEIAKERVPFGIYAVEKHGYGEFLNMNCQSITQLKQERRIFKQNGFKVHFNDERI